MIARGAANAGLKPNAAWVFPLAGSMRLLWGRLAACGRLAVGLVGLRNPPP